MFFGKKTALERFGKKWIQLSFLSFIKTDALNYFLD